MDKNRMSATKKENNVISMAFDAKFFFERAVRYLDKNNYSKALKYFWRTVEYEPQNPVHYCNIAGLLSEMERFEESNQILLYVIEKVDISLHECLFYLANNYAHMNEFELSYQYVQRYLEADPKGEYVEEANEMLDYLSIENDNDETDEWADKKELFMQNHKAKRLLAEGKYYDAAKHLLDIIDKYPDFSIARNNLSLAYFYMGNFPKALEQSSKVLEKEPANIHALGNLAIFYQQLNDIEELYKVIDRLKKIVPFKDDQLLKLATTFGILGEHELALKYIYRMLRKGVIEGPILYHQGAIAAYNLKKYDLAEKWWKEIIHQFPDESSVASYFLELTSHLQKDNIMLPVSMYEYGFPFEQQLEAIEVNLKLLYEDTIIPLSLKLGMKYAEEDPIKESILDILGFLKDDGIETTLRELLIDEKVSLEVKKKAMLLLEEMDVSTLFRVSLNGKIEEHERQTPPLEDWNPQWKTVLQLIEENIGASYNKLFSYRGKLLWYQFISSTASKPPQIRKAEGWAAAIEYMIAPLYGKKVSIERLSTKYHVSAPTIKKNIQLINEKITTNNLLKNVYFLL